MFTLLLIAQNVAVFFLVYMAFARGQTAEVVAVVASLVSVLVETYFLIRVMVQWLFTDIDYGKNQRAVEGLS